MIRGGGVPSPGGRPLGYTAASAYSWKPAAILGLHNTPYSYPPSPSATRPPIRHLDLQRLFSSCPADSEGRLSCKLLFLSIQIRHYLTYKMNNV